MIPFVREIGGFLRGDATPFQLFVGAFLAGIISFMPGFQQAPGLVSVFVLALLVLNSNLMIAGLTMGLGRLLALAIQPATFEVGQFFIDGPTSGVLTQLINGPVTAWFGFENYLATGGLALGAGYGGIMGLVIAIFMGTFRAKMAKLESGNMVYQAVVEQKWARAVGWLLFGGEKGDKSWAHKSKHNFGKPVRYVGVLALIVVVVLGVASPHLINDTWLGKIVASQLAQANGATVDIDSIEADLAGGKLAINTLAFADPNALDKNMFQTTRLEADVSNQDLYAKKYALKRLEISGARVGAERDTPGRKVGRPVKPAPDPDVEGSTETKGTGEGDSGEGGEGADVGEILGKGDKDYSIDGVLDKADEWKSYLAQIKKWLGKVSVPQGTGDGSGEIEGETLEERLRRLAAEQGFANVIASHRITDKPRFTIQELVVNDVEVSQLPGEVLNVLGTDLSTEPHLVEGASTLQITSESGRMGLELTVDQDAGPVSFHYSELPVDQVKGWLKDRSAFPFQGGSFNIQGSGTLSGAQIHLPVQVTPVGSSWNLPKLGTQPVPQVPFTVVISGDLDNPRIRPDLSSFAGSLKQGLIDAGKNKVKEKIGDRLNNFLRGDEDSEEGDDEEEKKGRNVLDSFLNR